MDRRDNCTSIQEFIEECEKPRSYEEKVNDAMFVIRRDVIIYLDTVRNPYLMAWKKYWEEMNNE